MGQRVSATQTKMCLASGETCEVWPRLQQAAAGCSRPLAPHRGSLLRPVVQGRRLKSAAQCRPVPGAGWLPTVAWLVVYGWKELKPVIFFESCCATVCPSEFANGKAPAAARW